LVKKKDQHGEEQVLCTSLKGKEQYRRENLSGLYDMRWALRKDIKCSRARVQVEAFSGKTAIAVKQDLFAKTMMVSLCATLAFPIKSKVIKE
jgi:hypothetical protein